MVFESSQAFLKCLEQLILANEVDEWNKKVSQGRIVHADHINSTLSSSHLVNLQLSESGLFGKQGWNSQRIIVSYTHIIQGHSDAFLRQHYQLRTELMSEEQKCDPDTSQQT